MGLYYTATKSKVKAKKKPGWQKQEEEYAAWLAKHSPNPKLQKELKAKAFDYKLSTPAGRETPTLPSRQTRIVKTEVIHDPRVLYKEDPEMLERELKARERKYTTAPIYNKGPDQLFTDEMMKELSAGTLRRR